MNMRRSTNPESFSKWFNLEAAACTLCTNRDKTRIVAAGRKVFKILDADQEEFRVVTNMRDLPLKQINLNYSSNHVQWNHKEENQLASAPTNGSVVLWDLKKSSKSKLAYVFDKIHQRASNRICYHPRDANILISGSQDSSIITLDTRLRQPVGQYNGPDSVRDVQFSPFNDNLIVAAFESGSCQIWDRRNPNSPKSVNAHMGPAYSCSWHIELENRFLSAGRDKTIKVFDIQYDRPREVYIVNTLFSVAHANWRPNHKNHITSCSHLFDKSVAVWDIRRPFLQYASFLEHSDDVTDFLWLNEDILLSCGKDGRLIQRHIDTATHQTDIAAPVSVSLRPDGCGLALSSSDCIAQKGKPYQSLSASRNPAQFRKKDDNPYQQLFLKHTSFLQEHQRNENKNDWLYIFKTCATQFQYEGLPTDQLCDHNYKVCISVGKSEEAHSWIILKLLYCGMIPECSPFRLLPITKQQQTCNEGIQSTNSLEKEKCDESSNYGNRKKGSVEDILIIEDDNNDIAGMLEFFEQCDDDSNSSTTESTQPELELPKEPFQLRQDIVTKSNLLELPEQETLLSGPGSQISGTSLPQSPLAFSVSSQNTHSPGVPNLVAPWDFPSQVSEMLKYYAEKGDVQMSVTIVMVFGSSVMKLIPQIILIQWFMSYVELLQQFLLLSEAAYIINRCPIKEVNETSQQSTLYSIGCGRCNRLLPPHTSTCQKCDTHPGICSVCHTNVRGLFSWCDVCCHGGHYKHLLNWFENNSLCPAGCGHQCIQ